MPDLIDTEKKHLLSSMWFSQSGNSVILSGNDSSEPYRNWREALKRDGIAHYPTLRVQECRNENVARINRPH